MADTDWAAWSRESRRLMQARNDAWLSRWELEDASFHWTLDPPELVFHRSGDDVVDDIIVVGTCSRHEGTFLWAWANETIPEAAQVGLDEVRDFGAEHDLGILIDAEWPAGHAESLEALIIAGRLLDAEGVFAAGTGDVTTYLAIRAFRARPGGGT